MKAHILGVIANSQTSAEGAAILSRLRLCPLSPMPGSHRLRCYGPPPSRVIRLVHHAPPSSCGKDCPVAKYAVLRWGLSCGLSFFLFFFKLISFFFLSFFLSFSLFFLFFFLSYFPSLHFSKSKLGARGDYSTAVKSTRRGAVASPRPNHAAHAAQRPPAVAAPDQQAEIASARASQPQYFAWEPASSMAGYQD